MAKHRQEAARNEATSMPRDKMTQVEISTLWTYRSGPTSACGRLTRSGRSSEKKPSFPAWAKASSPRGCQRNACHAENWWRELPATGHQMSRITVRTCLRSLSKFKPPMQPKLTEKQVRNRLCFGRERRDWSSTVSAHLNYSMLQTGRAELKADSTVVPRDVEQLLDERPPGCGTAQTSILWRTCQPSFRRSLPSCRPPAPAPGLVKNAKQSWVNTDSNISDNKEDTTIYSP